jgi:conjugal transfer pilus assembly protein TrbC
MKKILLYFCLLLSLQMASAATYCFVSLGMPDQVLKAYFVEAHHLHIPVVIRGLYTTDTKAHPMGTFQETAARLFDLVKDKKLGGVLINPLWFKQFNIQVVPALVVEKEKGFDVVYGNIPIKKQLTIIQDAN